MRFRKFSLRDIRWPIIASIAVGIILAGVAGMQYKTYVAKNQEMVRVLVPTHNIPPYATVQEKDVRWVSIAKGGEAPGTITDTSQIVGKITLSTLYKGEQIKTERIGDAKFCKGKQIISVSVDVTRCLGGWVAPGDLVDVWWVPVDSSMTTPGAGWLMVAPNAVVLDVRDSSGQTIYQSSSMQAGLAQAAVGAPATPPAVAILAVRSEDVPRVIGGASPKSQNIILAKKFMEVEAVGETSPAIGQDGSGTGDGNS